MLANHVDADEVTAAARSLTQFGLTWDATRLASQAALQTPDGRVSGAMLQLARDLKFGASAGAEDSGDVAEAPAAAAPPPGLVDAHAASRLSDREREVAELLLQGMPYRDIGSQLFISAKTVEHHVARIRRRLGAESRSELISMLRAILGRAELTICHCIGPHSAVSANVTTDTATAGSAFTTSELTANRPQATNR